MYNPSHFAETRVPVLHQLVRAHPLATLVTLNDEGLCADQIPLLLRDDGSPFGTLVGHVARANPLWSATKTEVQVLAIFQGPQAYISPNWYPTKAEHGKVVPTWNYVLVQARGTLQVHDDPVWLRQQASELTRQQEAAMPEPWAVDDAPRSYTDTMLRALVGISIPIATLQGKWKVSQNQPVANREGVVRGLSQAGGDGALAMASLVAASAPPPG